MTDVALGTGLTFVTFFVLFTLAGGASPKTAAIWSGTIGGAGALYGILSMTGRSGQGR